MIRSSRLYIPRCNRKVIYGFNNIRTLNLSHICSEKQPSGYPFAIDSLMKNESSTPKSNSTPNSNRFATMFSDSKPGKFKKSGNDKNSKQKGKSKAKKPVKKTMKFQFDSGSEQAQNAIKSMIVKVNEISRNYMVKYVNPDSNKLESKHLVEIVNSLDLNKDGLYVIPPSKEGDIPLVKLNKVHEMIKIYTDELALAKEKELLERGSIAAQKAARQRDKAEKKKSSTKVITISWNINTSDLNAQKKKEIQRRLEKGEKFIIYIGDKRSLYSARKTANKEGGLVDTLKVSNEEDILGDVEFEEGEEIDVEMRRRHMIYAQFKVILEELECQYDISGDIKSRLMISCSPSAKILAAKEERNKELSTKELKKQRKLMKQKDREGVQKTVKEDDLDSLYEFKIDP